MNSTYNEPAGFREQPASLSSFSLKGIMKRPPLSIGRFHDIELRVHVVWLIGAPLVGLLAATGRGSLQAAIAYFLLPVLWGLSVLAHEGGHALMAARLGRRVDSVSLLPMGGATAYDGPPSRARDQMLISGAGPAVSLLLAAGTLLIGLVAVGVARDWWLELAAFNAAIFVWNALPALPMDGGRTLQAALRAAGRNTSAAEREARQMGQATAYALGAVAGAVLVTAPVDRAMGVILALAFYGTGLMLLQFNGTRQPILSGAPVRVSEHRMASE